MKTTSPLVGGHKQNHSALCWLKQQCALWLYGTIFVSYLHYQPECTEWLSWIRNVHPAVCQHLKKKSPVSIINPKQKKRPWEKKIFYTHILSFSHECFVMSVCCLCVSGWVWVCVGTALCELCLLGLSCHPQAGSCEAKWKKIFQIKKT